MADKKKPIFDPILRSVVPQLIANEIVFGKDNDVPVEIGDEAMEEFRQRVQALINDKGEEE